MNIPKRVYKAANGRHGKLDDLMYRIGHYLKIHQCFRYLTAEQIADELRILNNLICGYEVDMPLRKSYLKKAYNIYTNMGSNERDQIPEVIGAFIEELWK